MTEITLNLYQITFWAAIIFTTIGALLGLMGVWIDDFWKGETAPKLLLIIFVTFVQIVVVIEFLQVQL